MKCIVLVVRGFRCDMTRGRAPGGTSGVRCSSEFYDFSYGY